ncbi:MAG: hypothetical protein J0G30_03295 [Actinomycetales bacterium]|nr:hypothetical protein [Actinomycetales bacterium]
MSGREAVERPRASIRVRAALAVGLVLGLGAGLTVASWTDASFVAGAFTASRFSLETNPNGAGYSSSSTVSASVAGVFPGAGGAVYLPFSVRTASDSVGGTLSLSAAANPAAGLPTVLRYRIVRGASACTAAGFSSGSYVAGDAATTRAMSASLPSTAAGSLAAGGASPLSYCIEFSIPSGTAATGIAGTSGTLTLTLTGTSS